MKKSITFSLRKQLKYTNSLIWVKNMHMCELSQKLSTDPRWAKLHLFRFFEKSFWNWRKHLVFASEQLKSKKFTHLQENCAHVWIEPKMSTEKVREKSRECHKPQLKYKNSLIWMKNKHMCELSKKCQQVHSPFFRFFWKVFEIEENHHFFSSTHQKYKNSLIWRKNVHMCELSKKCQQVHSPFFRFFLKVFGIEENHHFFLFYTPKIQKFTHLEEKCAHVWIEPKMSTGPQWAKPSIVQKKKIEVLPTSDLSTFLAQFIYVHIFLQMSEFLYFFLVCWSENMMIFFNFEKL